MQRGGASSRGNWLYVLDVGPVAGRRRPTLLDQLREALYSCHNYHCTELTCHHRSLAHCFFGVPCHCLQDSVAARSRRNGNDIRTIQERSHMICGRSVGQQFTQCIQAQEQRTT